MTNWFLKQSLQPLLKNELAWLTLNFFWHPWILNLDPESPSSSASLWSSVVGAGATHYSALFNALLSVDIYVASLYCTACYVYKKTVETRYLALLSYAKASQFRFFQWGNGENIWFFISWSEKKRDLGFKKLCFVATWALKMILWWTSECTFANQLERPIIAWSIPSSIVSAPTIKTTQLAPPHC